MQRSRIEVLSAWQRTWTVLSEARELLSLAAQQAAMHGGIDMAGGTGHLLRHSCVLYGRLVQLLMMLSQCCAEGRLMSSLPASFMAPPFVKVVQDCAARNV